MEQTGWSIGIDLGGSKIAAALVDPKGAIHHRIVVPTLAEEGAQAVISRIALLIHEILESSEIGNRLSVGVAVAGQVAAESGVVIFAPNLEWHHFPLKDELIKASALSVTIVNDVRAATWGEWHYGAGRGINDFVCLFIGTGIGGGIVSAGRLIEGSSNSAGELGHMIVSFDGRLCGCGNRGCLEALAGGRAIAEMAQELIKKYPHEGQPLLEAAGHLPLSVTPVEVFQLADRGDPMSTKIVDGVVNALIAGVVSMLHICNPLRVILGGGIVDRHPDLVGRIDAGVRRQALRVSLEKLTIVPSYLKSDAAVIGAAKLVK